MKTYSVLFLTVTINGCSIAPPIIQDSSPRFICVHEYDQSCGLSNRNYEVHHCCHGHGYGFDWCDGREATCDRKLNTIEALEWLATTKPSNYLINKLQNFHTFYTPQKQNYLFYPLIRPVLYL